MKELGGTNAILGLMTTLASEKTREGVFECWLSFLIMTSAPIGPPELPLMLGMFILYLASIFIINRE